MKKYPTFIYKEYVGTFTLSELDKLRKRFYELAERNKGKSPHIIYAYYSYDNKDERVYHFDILFKTEEEYELISSLPDHFIYAFHEQA